MSQLVEDAARGVAIEVLVAGAGVDVVLLASSMRGAADFAQLQADMAAAGFRTLAINMRGIGRSTGPGDGLTLRDLVEDVALVIERLCTGPVHVVGHALGNIVARAVAAFRPEWVKAVVVMPCGGHNLGHFPVAQHVLTHFARCHMAGLSEAERRESLSVAFFAPGNDPGSWLEGWWPQAAGTSGAALGTDPQLWWRAGGKPILILHPLKDAMASPEQGRAARDAFGAQADYVEIPDCGHAILPEQPAFIAREICGFLKRQG